MGEIKPSYDENRQILGIIYPLNTPFNVILDVSEACNFKCSYCFRSEDDKEMWGYARHKEYMPWDIFTRAVDQIREFPDEVKQISLSNHGEPLTNKKLPDMVRHIKNNGIKSRVSIHTNASLLDTEYVKDLADSNIDRVVVSLQGLNEDKYYETCGVKIDFQKFYDNLSLFHKIKKDTSLFVKIADAALGKGEEEKFYQMFQPIADRVYVEKVVPIWKGKEIQINLQDANINKYGGHFPIQRCCPLVFHTIVVIPNGDVYPCTQLTFPYKLGNIEFQSLSQIWNSEMRKEFLMKICRIENGNICGDCGILQNSIYAEEDMIDAYRLEILTRLEKSRD